MGFIKLWLPLIVFAAVIAGALVSTSLYSHHVFGSAEGSIGNMTEGTAGW